MSWDIHIRYIDLTICDADGNRCYTTDNKLFLTVSGAAHLGGSREIDVTAGLARVTIRSTGRPGNIEIVAAGKDLRSGQLKLRAWAQPCLSF